MPTVTKILFFVVGVGLTFPFWLAQWQTGRGKKGKP